MKKNTYSVKYENGKILHFGQINLEEAKKLASLSWLFGFGHIILLKNYNPILIKKTNKKNNYLKKIWNKYNW